MPADRIPNDYLFDLYRNYVGEPDNRRDVYVGFGLFLSGIALAIVGFVLFLLSTTLEARGEGYFTWVRPAYAVGMISLPTMMLGLVFLLPSDRRIRGVSMGGLAVVIAATIGFYSVYPDNWNFHSGDDYTVHVVATYAVGLAAITASTGAALIAHYLDLARSVEAVQNENEADESDQFTDDEIREDIDAAMEGVELSWGGVEQSEHKRLEFSDHDFEGAQLNVEAKTTRSAGVDSQVAGLKGLKGGDKKTTTSSSTVDDQTSKLKELREQKQREESTEQNEGFVQSAQRKATRFISRLRRS